MKKKLNKLSIVRLTEDEKQQIMNHIIDKDISLAHFVRAAIQEQLECEEVPELSLLHAEGKTERISFLLSPEMKDSLQDYCETNYNGNRYMSSFVRYATQKQIKKE